MANDLVLDPNDQQIVVITGPNMSGKSALLRQTALIVLLAQAGSFVPAKAARIGLVDRIFTRVGASDNLSTGESTFMVEMNETASILNNLSERSLVLLDEIGRGTSAYDGPIHRLGHRRVPARASGASEKTLFATHYHEPDNSRRLSHDAMPAWRCGKWMAACISCASWCRGAATAVSVSTWHRWLVCRTR